MMRLSCLPGRTLYTLKCFYHIFAFRSLRNLWCSYSVVHILVYLSSLLSRCTAEAYCTVICMCWSTVQCSCNINEHASCTASSQKPFGYSDLFNTKSKYMIFVVGSNHKLTKRFSVGSICLIPIFLANLNETLLSFSSIFSCLICRICLL